MPVKVAHFFFLPKILVYLARDGLPLALVHQHGGIGQQPGVIGAGHRRAHQQGRAVVQGLGQAVQTGAAALGKVFRAQVAARCRAAQGQFRGDAQVGSVFGGMAGSGYDALHIAGHIAGNDIALQHGNLHG